MILFSRVLRDSTARYVGPSITTKTTLATVTSATTLIQKSTLTPTAATATTATMEKLKPTRRKRH